MAVREWKWQTAQYTLESGARFTVRRDGTILEGPKVYMGRIAWRGAGRHLFLAGDRPIDLGRIVRHVELSAPVSKVDTVEVGPVERSLKRSPTNGAT